MLHAIIMAGGTGTRFWPASRNDSPKQLLQLVGERDDDPSDARSARQAGAERAAAGGHESAAGRGRAEAVAGAAGSGSRRRAVQARHGTVHRAGGPAGEPRRSGRDHGRDAGRPCDSAGGEVSGGDRTGGRTGRGVAGPDRHVWHSAEVSGGDLWVHPSRRAAIRRPGLVHASYRVQQFKEKPDAATAAKYLASGEYYWNSGIFVWRASTILDALRERQPEMLEHLEAIVAAWDTPQARRRSSIASSPRSSRSRSTTP